MKPVLQALVLAERIYEDRSGKKIIAGTFNRVVIAPISEAEQKHPDGSKRSLIRGGTDPGCPSAYISLTDVVDGTKISLQFVDISRNKILFGTSFVIKPKDRLATTEIVAPLPPFRRFINKKQAGTFSFEVIWEGEILGSHRILVVNAE